MVFNILNYIKSCPYLSDFSFNVEFLGMNPYSVSVCGRSEREIVKIYTDGDELVKDKFSIKMRLPYGADMEKNIDNSGLLENVSRWFSQNNTRGILPELGENGVAISISADFSKEPGVYLADTAVYTAQVAVLYYREKSR